MTLLPEIISKEPLGPMVRKGDDKFFDVVKWTHFAQLTAEEYGITSKNVDTFTTSTDPSIRRLMGVEGDMGKALGIDNKWAYNAHQAGRQFRRGLGSQHHRPGRAARDQRAVEQGRPAIRPADPLATRSGPDGNAVPILGAAFAFTPLLRRRSCKGLHSGCNAAEV